MPDEPMVWKPRSEILTFEEIERIAKVLVERFGITGIRITGGEPTVRAHLPLLVGRLAKLRVGGDGAPVELAMTTNGATLRLLARDLAEAGLSRVNISCDSLRRERFASITGRDRLDAVLDGIDAAIEAGLRPLKINCVLVRGVNDDEIVDLAAFGRSRAADLRFIEWMPLDGAGRWDRNQVVAAGEVLAKIGSVFPLEPVDPSERGSAPAESYRYADGKGSVGVISSVSAPFCGSCDRVRLTADGQFRNCLFAVRETDLRALLRDGGSDDDLAEALRVEVAAKWAGHRIGQVDFIRPSRSMSQIGG
jgi:cyclic pyranopterin phosphate synthase